eukprot:gene8050-16508_t
MLSNDKTIGVKCVFPTDLALVYSKHPVPSSTQRKISWSFRVSGNDSWAMGVVPESHVGESDFLYTKAKVGFNSSGNLSGCLPSKSMHGKLITVVLDADVKTADMYIDNTLERSFLVDDGDFPARLGISGFGGTIATLEALTTILKAPTSQHEFKPICSNNHLMTKVIKEEITSLSTKTLNSTEEDNIEGRYNMILQIVIMQCVKASRNEENLVQTVSRARYLEFSCFLQRMQSQSVILTPEAFVDIPDTRKLLAWNIYLEAIKRVDNTASIKHTDSDDDDVSDEDSDEDLDDSKRKATELIMNNEGMLHAITAAPLLSAANSRTSSSRMKSIDDYEPIDNIRSLLAVKDRNNNTVLHHTAFLRLHSSYNKLMKCGASSWLMNSNGETAAGLMAGVNGHHCLFQLHRACLRHNFLDEDLTTAALRCPINYDLPDELLHVWTLINDGQAEDAIGHARTLDESNNILVSDHYHMFVALAILLAGYGEKTTMLELSDYERYVRSRKSDNSFYLHPVYFYLHYRLYMQTPPKGKSTRRRAADALSAFKCFHKLSERFLTAMDNIDDIVEVEIKDQDKFDEDSDDDNDDIELEEDLPPDFPEIEWVEVKKQLGKTSPSMDKLMALTGLKEVKKKAMDVYKEVLLTPFRPDDLKNRTTMNFLFVGNPGTGKTTVAELLAEGMVEIGFRTNPIPFLTNAGDILNAKDPAGEFEKLVNKAIGGTVFIDEAYLLRPAPRGQTANASNEVLDFLLKVAEEKRDTTTFILAGYKDDTEALLSYSEGFSSRFPKQFTFNFEDFDEIQLRRILKTMVSARGCLFESKKLCNVDLPKVLSRRIARGIGKHGFGNAREVRNCVDKCISRQTTRLGNFVLTKKQARLSKSSQSTSTVDKRMMRTLTVSDTIGDRPVFTSSIHLRDLNDMIGLTGVKSAIKASELRQRIPWREGRTNFTAHSVLWQS